MDTDAIEFDNFTIVFSFDKQSPVPTKPLRENLMDEGYRLGDEQEKQNLQVRSSGELSELYVEEGDQKALAYFSNDGVLALTWENSEPGNIPQSISEIKSILFDEIGGTKDDFENAEIQARAKIWKGKDTTVFFEDIYDLGFEVSDILGSEGQPSGFRLISDKDVNDKADSFDVRLEPLLQNTDYYFIQLRYSQSDVDEIIEFSDSIHENISRLVEKVEAEKSSGLQIQQGNMWEESGDQLDNFPTRRTPRGQPKIEDEPFLQHSPHIRPDLIFEEEQENKPKTPSRSFHSVYQQEDPKWIEPFGPSPSGIGSIQEEAATIFSHIIEEYQSTLDWESELHDAASKLEASGSTGSKDSQDEAYERLLDAATHVSVNELETRHIQLLFEGLDSLDNKQQEELREVLADFAEGVTPSPLQSDNKDTDISSLQDLKQKTEDFFEGLQFYLNQQAEYGADTEKLKRDQLRVFLKHRITEIEGR
ncbi:MAG: hypothetical protein ABEI86_06720 [Halobacteriaceae archaeon]